MDPFSTLQLYSRVSEGIWSGVAITLVMQGLHCLQFYNFCLTYSLIAYPSLRMDGQTKSWAMHGFKMILIPRLETKLVDGIAFSFWMAITRMVLTSSVSMLLITRLSLYVFPHTQHTPFSLVTLGLLDLLRSHGSKW